MCELIQTVTFGVVAYNEEKYLPDLLSDLLCQKYDKSLVEVIIVDGESTDKTWEIMQAFQDKYKDVFKSIKLLKNHKKIQPAGWNIVIENAKEDILIRVDAHARIPADFIEKNVECMNQGEHVCGGPRVNIIDDESSLWKRLLLGAEQSMFGAGIASYRNETESKKYVKSVFHAAYRRQVIEDVGLFNEQLTRTEDNEYHYRIREKGYKICYDPDINSLYQTRNTLRSMLKQKFLNGFWIGKTLLYCPKCISVFHIVPAIFVISIIVTAFLSIVGYEILGIILWGMYFLVTLLITVMAIFEHKNIAFFILPLIFLMLHLIYGVGTIYGLVVGVLEVIKHTKI